MSCSRMRTSGLSVLSFAGVVSAAFAPSAVLFAAVVGKHPELIILLVGAAFLWLCAISLVAAIWAVFKALNGISDDDRPDAFALHALGGGHEQTWWRIQDERRVLYMYQPP